MWAVSGGGDCNCRSLLANHANIDDADNSGTTPLMKAASDGLTDVVALLLEKGANIDAKDNAGDTVLTLATSKRQTEVVKLLQEKGAH